MMIYHLSTISFLVAAAGFASLGISICRRAQRTSEVRVLLLMLGIFALQFVLLSLDALLFGILGIMPVQSHALLAALENSLSLFAIGAVFHFVFLTYSKALDESGLLADPFSPFRNYKGQYWFWVMASYSMPVASVGRYAYLVFRAWHAHPSSKLVFPPGPPQMFFTGGAVGIFFLGLLLIEWVKNGR